MIPEITKLRFQFTLTDGRKADVLLPIPTASDPVAGTGWYSVNVPVSSLKFAAGGEPMLQSVTVAGNQFGVFYIGRMQVGPLTAALPEAAPVTAEDPEDDNGPMYEQPGQENGRGGEQQNPGGGNGDQRGPQDGRGE